MRSNLNYPDSPCVRVVETIHGKRIVDPYRWLEDINSKETKNWIEKQNTLTLDYLEKIKARPRIRKRLKELWDYKHYGVPIKKGGRYFFTCKDGLQNQGILYWMDSLDNEAQVLLDPNELSEDGTIALTGYAISKDGRFLAYGLSTAGSDWQEWKVRRVEDGQDLEDHLEWIKFLPEVSWVPNNEGFFYSRYDQPEKGSEYKATNYCQKLYYHRLGTSQADDELIYERPDKKEWGFDGRVTDDGCYLIITVSKGTHRENGIFYKDLTDPNGQVVELLNGFDASYRFVGNDGSLFYITTDFGAPNLRMVEINLNQPEPSYWRDVIPESSDVLQKVNLIGDKFIAQYLHDVKSKVKIFSKMGKLEREVNLPGIGTVEGFTGCKGDKETFYLFTSFTSPGTVYHYNVETGESTLFREPIVNFKADDYVTEQVFYKSKDGTKVPMFVTHKRGIKRTGDNPTYLYGYGGYNIPLTPSFSESNLLWMEMGGIYAQANLRGGGEYGKRWHEAGKVLNKQNVFDDFIAAAEWLIDNNYTNPQKLAISGRSNGGLLVGACMTQRPKLFGACAPVVGVLDMLRFHKFTIGWGWVSDFGSPDNPDEFEALLSYSPYHNIKPGTEYPPTLIVTGDHDDRVFPAHSFKFAAALQKAQGGDAPVLLRVEERTGHGFGKPTSKKIDEESDILSFFVDALDMEVD